MSEPLCLFIGIEKQKLYACDTSLTQKSISDLFYGDTLSMRVYLLKENGSTANNYPTPWDVVNISDLSLNLAIGSATTDDVTLPIASQNSWSKDPDNKFFYADVSLATAEIKAALGSSSSMQRTLEIKQDKGGYKTTIYQQLVTIKTRVIGPTTVVPIPPDTPLSKEEAVGTFCKKISDAGEIWRLVSPNGLYAVDLRVDNDGILHTDQVTI